MFQEFEGMVQKMASGDVDQRAVGDAAAQHVNGTDANELTQHVQTAAQNAQQNGDTSPAQQLTSLAEQYRSDPQNLTGEIITLITDNPQILQQFAPEFVRGILGRI